jgi:CubicO group peptidase (beta-lactamase class C family)
MITLVFTFTILLTGCASNETTSVQESTKANYKEIQSKLIKSMDDYSKKDGFSGTILIAKDGDILLDRGYGMADYDNNIDNTTHTVFEIASLTKQFTATAILMLQEKKLLNVQDTLNKYISDYHNGDKIKIYNLLTHTSGIPDNLKIVDSLESGRHTYTHDELIQMFKNKQLDFDLGTSYEYSNSNYVLLGDIIEKVSKMKYEDYIQKNILIPLKMNETGFLSNQSTIKDKAIGYSVIWENTNKYTKAIDLESSLPYSAGEICSTVEDLYRWESALFTGKLIKKESLDEMFTPYLNNYGYGWFINKDSEGDKLIFHDGSLPGYTTSIERNADKKYMIIILSNKEFNKSVHDIQSGLSQLLENT